MARLKGWRFGVFIGSFVGAVGTTLYFSAVRPMLNPEPFKKIREDAIPKLRPKSSFN